MNLRKIFGSRLLWIVLIALPAGSCVKTAAHPGAASLTLVNAFVGSTPILTNFNDGQPLTYWWTAYMLNYGLFEPQDEMSFYSGIQHIAFFRYGDTTAQSVPILKTTVNLPVGSFNTLFCVGTVDNPDTMFLRDSIPYYGTDSVAGIRFINVSPGSAPISVNISGQPYGSLVSSLPYKGVTGFIRFPANSTVFNYAFEFRDAATGTLITSRTIRNVGQPGMDYAPNNYLFKSNSIVFIGSPGATVYNNMQRVYLMNNF